MNSYALLITKQRAKGEGGGRAELNGGEGAAWQVEQRIEGAWRLAEVDRDDELSEGGRGTGKQEVILT